MVADDVRYTVEHEWVRDTGTGTVRIGITHFAQDALGDIVFVSLPAVGTHVAAGTACGEVESTKSVSDIYVPVTGEVVARHAARLWAGQATPPLLTSFQPDALEGARHSAPALPRGLLLDALHDGWLAKAQQLGCVAVVCNHALWDAPTVQAVQQAGLRALSYTVNDEWAAQRLIDLGTDGIITDRVDLFSPAG